MARALGDQRLVDACDDRGRGFERFLVACCFKRCRPHWDAVYVYAVCLGVVPRRAHLRILGEERPRACAVGVPLALLELECAAVEVEAPFKLRLDCCDSLRRGYGGRIIHDGPHYLGPRAPFLSQCTEEPVQVGFKPHAKQCRPERAALLCAFHRGEVCPRGVCGEWCAGPQEGADKGQEAPDRGRRFCKALCQKGSGELVESVFEVQFPDCEVRAVFEHRPDAEGEFLR